MIKRKNDGYEKLLEQLPIVYCTGLVMNLSFKYACELYFDKKEYNIETLYKYLNKNKNHKNVKSTIKKIDEHNEILKARIVNEKFNQYGKRYSDYVITIDSILQDRLKNNEPLLPLDDTDNKNQILSQYGRAKKIGALKDFNYFKDLKKNEDDLSKKMVTNYEENLRNLTEVIKEIIESKIINHELGKIETHDLLMKEINETKKTNKKEKVKKI